MSKREYRVGLFHQRFMRYKRFIENSISSPSGLRFAVPPISFFFFLFRGNGIWEELNVKNGSISSQDADISRLDKGLDKGSLIG